MEQLDALLIRDKLNLIIVTTRDEGLLKSAGITLRYNLRGMDIPDGKKLFCCHAFSQPHPACGYEDLVDAFVKECGGLPLSLKVFGRHVRGRSDHRYWLSELQKIRRVLPEDVIRRLKVSFDSLDEEEKQIFMDITCFFIGKFRSVAIKIWEISGWTAEHALQRLKDKCLVEEINHFNDLEDKAFRMHDHLRDLGREMADKQSPRRLWRPRDLQSLELKGFQETLAETNGRCFHSMPDRSIDAQITFFLGNPDDSAQTSTSLLLLKLEMNNREHTCIPSWIPLEKLRYLKIFYGRLKRLWQNNVQVPPQLKELVISHTLLEEFPDLLGIENQLERVVINGNGIEIQGWCLLKSLNPRSFVLNSESTITVRGELTCSVIRQVQSSTMYMSPQFPNLLLFDNLELKGILSLNNGGQSNIDAGKLVDLNINACHELEELCLEGLHCLQRIEIHGCKKLICLEFIGCKKLKTVSAIKNLQNLEMLNIRDCPELQDVKHLEQLVSLEKITIDGCGKINHLELRYCEKLKTVSGNFDVTELVIDECRELEELPSLAQMSHLERIEIIGLVKLKCLEFIGCKRLKTVSARENLQSFETLNIRDCPDLEELKPLKSLNSLKNITIDGCGKINRLELRCCKNLKTVSGNFDVTELVIDECRELEELPSLAQMSRLERIEMRGCEKLHIAGIEELQGLKTFIVHSNSNKSLQRLSRLPSEYMRVIGRAGDGAHSTLNSPLFNCIMRNPAAVHKIHTGEDGTARVEISVDDIGGESDCLSAIIVCAHVVVREKCPHPSLLFSYLEVVEEREWIVSMAMSGENRINHFIQDKQRIPISIWENRHEVIKNACMVTVKKGQEWEALQVVKAIGKLYK